MRSIAEQDRRNRSIQRRRDHAVYLVANFLAYLGPQPILDEEGVQTGEYYTIDLAVPAERALAESYFEVVREGLVTVLGAAFKKLSFDTALALLKPNAGPTTGRGTAKKGAGITARWAAAVGLEGNAKLYRGSSTELGRVRNR